MTAAFVQRVTALAAVALLAALVALALISRREKTAASTLPQPVPAADGGWYHASAAVRSGQTGRHTSCGILVRAGTAGVGDPVLPCGAKIFVLFGPRRALTQVIDRSAGATSYRFELTPALAQQLGLSGVQPVRWAFARPASGTK